MSRLPIPGGDDNVWGQLLNDFLDVEHYDDGTLKIRTDGTLTPGNLGALSASNNLSDVPNIAQARSNLQLGEASTLNVGTTSGTVAAGDDNRFASSTNFVDLTSIQTKTGVLTAPLIDYGGTVFDVRAYGAKVNGSTDDTVAIQSAINAAATAGGGIVCIPAGVTIVSNTLVLGNRVWLRGAGMRATTIQLANNSNCTVIANHVSPDGVQANAEYCTVSELQINGNKANQSGTSHGIYFTCNPSSSMASGDDSNDTHQLVMNVKIYEPLTHGFYAVGRSEMRLHNVYVFEAGQNSFYPSYDSFLSNCTSEGSGYEGFYFAHSNIMAVNCKAFGSGMALTSRGDGFYIQAGDSLVMATCDAQNNLARGFHVNSSQSVVLQACMADSNNFGTGNSNTAYAGVEVIGSSYCIIDFASVQSYQNGNLVGNQYDALRIQGSSYNTITLSHYAQAGYTAGPAVTTDSTVGNNAISTNGIPTFSSAGISTVQTSTILQPASTAGSGSNTTITAQAGMSGGNNMAGGNLQLQPGQTTGGGSAYLQLYGAAASTGPVGALSLYSGGSGYSVNDVLTMSSGSNDATITVNTVNGSGTIQTFTLTTAGTSYAIFLAQPTTGGTGSGATFSVVSLTGSSSNSLTSLMQLGGKTNEIGIGPGTNPDSSGTQLVTINPGTKAVYTDYASLGIGGTTTNNPAGGFYGATFLPSNSPGLGVTNQYGVGAKGGPTMGGAGTLSNLISFIGTPVMSGTGTTTNMLAFSATPYLTNGQVSNYTAFWANSFGGTGGALTSFTGLGINGIGTGVSQHNFTGVSIAANSASSTAYGINIGSITSAGTAYAIYTNTGKVSLGDQLVLRSATPLQINSGAAANSLLQSDASGNATWSSQITVSSINSSTSSLGSITATGLTANSTVTMDGVHDNSPLSTFFTANGAYAAGGLYASQFIANANPGAGNTAYWLTGSKTAADMTGPGTLSNMYGSIGIVQNSSSGTVTQATGLAIIPYLTGSGGVMTNYSGISLNAPAGTTAGTWSNYTGLNISSIGSSAAQQNFTGIAIAANSASSGTAYGIQISSITSSGTAYAIYTNAGKVSLGDQLYLRSSTPLQIPTGANTGYVLTSDASGNATWQTVTNIDGVTISGTASSGQAVVTSSSSAAAWTTIPTTAANSFTGSQTAPVLIASGLSGATAASRYVGATVTGAPTTGTFAVGDFVIDQSGKLWICTTAGTPGTWTAGSGVTLDSTATDIQPAGIQAAGGTGKAADAGHVHPNHSDQTLYLAPTGSTGETFPRQYASAYFSSLTSEQVYTSAISLPKGLPVNNLTLIVGGTAWTTANVSHGWYALLDSSGVVRAVSADQTSGNWGSTFSAVTLSVSGSSYTTTYGGLYYVAFCATFTGSSGEFPALPAPLGSVSGLTPVLSGTSSSGQTTPPSAGTTLAAISSVSATRFYAYAS